MNIPLVANNTNLLGFLKEVNVDAAYVTSVFGQKLKAYRLDNSSGSTQVIEDTTNAKSTTPNAFNPFSGSFISGTATLKVYESTDGTWASNLRTLISGSITDFKTTGWHKLDFGENAARLAWKPSNSPTLNAPSLKYIMFELDDGGTKDSFIVADEDDDIVAVLFKVDTVGTASVAAKISDMRIVRKSSQYKYIDVTTRSQGDTAVTYTPTPDTFLPIKGGRAIYGFNELPKELIEYVFRKDGAGTTYKVFVSGADNALIDITSQFASLSDFRQNGPTTNSNTTSHYVSVVPSVTGFTKRSLGSINIEGGSALVTPSMYYLVHEIDTATEAPQNTSIYRLRSKQLGSANSEGITFTEAKTLKSITLQLRGPKTGTGARTIAIANLSSSVQGSRDVVIPTTAVQGDFVHVNFADLSFAVGDKLGILEGVAGGATYEDVIPFIEGLN